MPGTNKVTLRVDWTFRFLLRLSQAELAPFMSKIPIQNQIKKMLIMKWLLATCNKNSNINIYKFLIFIFLYNFTFFFLDSLLNNNHKLIQINYYASIILNKKIVFCLFFHKLRECMSAESQMKLKSHKMSESLPWSLWQLYSTFTAST